ncbi:MAG: hypothetical protein LC808_11065 [Actinobacteria bacterium]|nr:hypothetical protein [Actinomycetota bacterium]
MSAAQLGPAALISPWLQRRGLGAFRSHEFGTGAVHGNDGDRVAHAVDAERHPVRFRGSPRAQDPAEVASARGWGSPLGPPRLPTRLLQGHTIAGSLWPDSPSYGAVARDAKRDDP